MDVAASGLNPGVLPPFPMHKKFNLEMKYGSNIGPWSNKRRLNEQAFPLSARQPLLKLSQLTFWPPATARLRLEITRSSSQFTVHRDVDFCQINSKYNGINDLNSLILYYTKY
ncbi:MAG: hypothetical protein ACYDDT_11345 [Sulfuricella sp.]